MVLNGFDDVALQDVWVWHEGNPLEWMSLVVNNQSTSVTYGGVAPNYGARYAGASFFGAGRIYMYGLTWIATIALANF